MTIVTRLRNFAEAIADPTRADIVAEIDRAGELTATQLARRLNLTPNNTYHHMRVLRELDVVDPPRSVAGNTYVEKYYHINPELHEALYNPVAVTKDMTPEERQDALVSLCLTMSHIMRRAAHEYAEMDPGMLAQRLRDESVMISIRTVAREELEDRLGELRKALAAGDTKFAESTKPRTDLLLIAGLPDLWHKEAESE